MTDRIRGTLFWFAALLLIWEAVARVGIFPELVLPPLSLVFTDFVHELIGGDLLQSTAVSLLYVFAGLGLGAAAAFALSSAAFQFPVIERLASMLTAILHPLPGIAVLPIFILFFGIGRATLVAVILHSVVWPLFVNISAGFASVPAVYRRIGANYGLGAREFYFRIMIPAAFPHIFSGLKTAWARAWRAAVSAEMIFGLTGSSGGLGWFVFSKRIFMDTPGMYAGILMLAVLGLSVESGVFHLIEAKTLGKWGEK